MRHFPLVKTFTTFTSDGLQCCSKCFLPQHKSLLRYASEIKEHAPRAAGKLALKALAHGDIAFIHLHAGICMMDRGGEAYRKRQPAVMFGKMRKRRRGSRYGCCFGAA